MQILRQILRLAITVDFVGGGRGGGRFSLAEEDARVKVG